MTRWGWIAVAGAFCAALLVPAVSAYADEGCPPLDVSCLSDQVTGMADDAVGDPVGDLPDDPVGKVQHHPVVQPLTDRVDRVLHGVRSGTPVARVGGAGDAGSNRGPDGPTLPSGGGPRVGGRPRFAGGPRGIASSRDDLLSVARPFRRATGIGDRIGRVLIGAAESLVAVLLLFGVTLAFALVQNRIDRNDPKLALAPMRPEVIPFA